MCVCNTTPDPLCVQGQCAVVSAINCASSAEHNSHIHCEFARGLTNMV